ncbi:MAG TPA: hypothetical protein VN181_15855, partial [Thermoanaerobaculia bacterium]|nr:hypothetical protein [Thermoanaerobaculia bacterium]
EKIRITIPENGVSVIRGDAGALPAGAIAVAVRRERAFIEQYQTQVTAAGGSFSFNAGRTATNDQIATTDTIDLEIVDSISHAVIAVIPLTPFVSVDGLGFIAPANTPSIFKAADPLGVTIRVPAGAFETPTLIRVAPSTKSDFAAVPSLDDELSVHAAVDLRFEGRANKPLDVDLPIPPNTPIANTFLLGRLGESSLGPRVEIDDLVRVDGSQFTTRPDGISAKAKLRQGVNTTLTGTDVKSYLLRVVRSGKYAVTEVKTGGSMLAWAAMDGVQSGLDLFWDAFHSLYASEEYVTAGRGRVLVPVLANRAFTIDGVDAATGITLFSKTYDGVPVAPPGTATGILPPQPNSGGPYPVFGSPFNIQIVEITRAIDRIEPLPGITIETPFATSADSGAVIVRFNDAARVGDPPRHLQVLNIRSGDLSTLGSTSVTIDAAVGDRLALFITAEAIEPRADLSVIFNEAISIPSGNVDEELRRLFVLEHNVSGAYRSVASQTTFSVDSGYRRVRLHAQLQSGGEYRLRLNKQIRDEFGGSPDLALAQPKGGDAKDLDLYFSVRKPKGDLRGPIALSRGTVRDLALDGNLLLVSALEGGLLAFDASDAANINGMPFARAIALPDADANPPIAGQSWSVDVDRHGRVWTTAMTSEFGVVRTFRSEDFADKLGETNPQQSIVEPYGSGLVSWRPGATSLLNSGSEFEILSDRPEATPRRMQIATQDESLVLTGGADLDAKLAQPNPLGVTGTSTGVLDDFKVYTINVKTLGGTFAYLTQRISVHNETLGVRWSKDGNSGPAAPGGTNVTFDNILV